MSRPAWPIAMEVHSEPRFHALHRVVGSLCGAALILLPSCVPAKPASLAQLRMRAAFDLGCPLHLLQVYPLDARSRAVVGCGHRLAYVEVCEPHHGRTGCGWVLDSPSWAPAPLTSSAPVSGPILGAASHSVPASPTQADAAAASASPAAPTSPPGPEIRDLGY